MERFKDRAWRLFGAKVPVELRPQIHERFKKRKDEWTRRRINGLLGSTMRAYAPAIVESITRDFVLTRLIDEGYLKPSVFEDPLLKS